MANPNIVITKVLEADIPTTGTNGYFYYTEKGNCYVSSSSGSLTKISDVIVVSSLPTSNIINNKLYLLTTNSSLNVYNGTSWTSVGSSSGSGLSNWVSGKGYAANDVVIYSNNIYQCNTSNSDSIWTSSNWNKLSSSNSVSWGSDLTGSTNTSQTVAKLQGVPLSISGASLGQLIGRTSNGFEPVNVNVTGIVGSTTIAQSGSDTTISAGSETLFTHTTSDKILVNTYEVISGSTVNDTSVDFSSTNKYNLQDSSKITVVNSNAQLATNTDSYTKLLMHFDGNFDDSISNTITNSGASVSTSTFKFGTGSGYFNGSSYLTVTPTKSSDFSFSGDFTIDAWMYFNSVSGDQCLVEFRTASESTCLTIATYNGKMSFAVGSSWLIYGSTVTTGQWYHVAVVRYSNTITLYINGVSSGTCSLSTTLGLNGNNTFIIGRFATGTMLSGYIDELRISNGVARWTSNFTPSTATYGNCTANIPYYISTTSLSDYSLVGVNIINSLTIPVTTPTNTTVKCLASFNNRTNWLYHDATNGWTKYTGDLTSVWTNSNTYTDLQTYFTNKTIASLATDLSSLSISPVSLDLIFQLETTDATATPSISVLTCNYTTNSHIEGASVGSFSADGTRYGLKIIDSASFSIKNKDTISHTIRVYTVVSS